jgi:hypothetical protein
MKGRGEYLASPHEGKRFGMIGKMKWIIDSQFEI